MRVSDPATPDLERDLFGAAPPEGYADWSHRRAEPRVLALLWMIYLMGISALMFSRLSAGLSISPSISQPASREMLVLASVGLGVLYPLVRLSQRSARRPIRSAIRDAVVLLVPLQAVLWPQLLIVLGGWNLDVVLALVAHFAAWTLVATGLVAIAHIVVERDDGAHRNLRRAVAMVAILGAMLVAPAIELITLRGAHAGLRDANPGLMLSPITGVIEITRERAATGVAASVGPLHFRLIAGVACVGLALMLLAGAWGGVSRRGGPARR